MNNDLENSLFKFRLNQRLFYLGQKYSHINLTKLFQIQSSSTKIMTYSCFKFCGGWGDRLRGITSVYVLAILLERRFVIDMKYPCDISRFLLPNLIDWLPKPSYDRKRKILNINTLYHKTRNEFRLNMTSVNLAEKWSIYDDIYITTNSDYITPILQNPFFESIKSEINILENESTQIDLFPFIFEILFKPTSIIAENVNRLLLKHSHNSNKEIVCMHIRIGKNPTVPHDVNTRFRDGIHYDMMKFVDKHFNSSHSSVYVTADSDEIQNIIAKHYSENRLLTVPGPIIHIDRHDPKLISPEHVYRGYVKTISDFYFLGECDALLKPRSGFSEWANYRRLNPYSKLYMYCRGIHSVNSAEWKRPYTVC